MARYAIKAYEDMYGGLHGMFRLLVTEGTLKEAQCEAHELSRDVIESYSETSNRMREEAEEEYGSGYTDDDLEEICNNHVTYEIYRIKDDCPLTDAEIDEEMFQRMEEFVERWCEEV